MISGRATRWAIAAAGAGLMLGAGASSASASQTFGSDLVEPINAIGENGCIVAGPCTTLTDMVRPGNAFPVSSPIDGVVVSFGIKTGDPETITFRLGQVPGPALAGIGTGTGPTANLAAAGTYSIPARLPVHTGDLVGFDYTTNHSNSTAGNGHAVYYAPPLADGAAPQAVQSNGIADHLVNAVVEADADNDGYGDETQDLCPGNSAIHDACPTTPAATPTPTPTPTPVPRKKKCKKKHHRSLYASAAKKCKQHRK
jgi:hypothetical protein